MSVKLLTEQHLEFLSLKLGCTGSYESTLVKMPHYWKSYITASTRDVGTYRIYATFMLTFSVGLEV